jgi:hypothetical protein
MNEDVAVTEPGTRTGNLFWRHRRRRPLAVALHQSPIFYRLHRRCARRGLVRDQ